MCLAVGLCYQLRKFGRLRTLFGQYDDLASRPRAEASDLRPLDHLLLRLLMSQTTDDHRYALSPKDIHVYASTP